MLSDSLCTLANAWQEGDTTGGTDHRLRYSQADVPSTLGGLHQVPTDTPE